MSLVPAGRPPFLLRAPGEKIARKSTHQAHELLEVLLGPVSEHLSGQSLARLVQSDRHRASLSGDHRPTDALVGFGGMTADKPETFKLCHLTADGRVIPPGQLGQLHHADRAMTLNSHEERKESAIQSNAGFLNKRRIALRPVHETH